MTPVCEPSGAQAVFQRVSTRFQIVALGCACAGASAFVFAVDPHQHAFYPQCFLYQTTGFYCAGCGATRALYALLHGRVLEALHDNVLFVGALPVLLMTAGLYLLSAWNRNAWPPLALNHQALLRRGGWIFLLMVFFMVARNLPGAPFDLLRPF